MKIYRSKRNNSYITESIVDSEYSSEWQDTKREWYEDKKREREIREYLEQKFDFNEKMQSTIEKFRIPRKKYRILRTILIDCCYKKYEEIKDHDISFISEKEWNILRNIQIEFFQKMIK